MIQYLTVTVFFFTFSGYVYYNSIIDVSLDVCESKDDYNFNKFLKRSVQGLYKGISLI